MNPLDHQAPAKLKSTNSTGYPHISFHSATGKFRADAKLYGQRTYIGLYDSPIEALAAQVRVLTAELNELGKLLGEVFTPDAIARIHAALDEPIPEGICAEIAAETTRLIAADMAQ